MEARKSDQATAAANHRNDRDYCPCPTVGMGVPIGRWTGERGGRIGSGSSNALSLWEAKQHADPTTIVEKTMGMAAMMIQVLMPASLASCPTLYQSLIQPTTTSASDE